MTDQLPAAARSRVAASPDIHPGARALYSVATSLDAGTDPAAILQAVAHRCAAAVGARQADLIVSTGADADTVAAAWPSRGSVLPEIDSASGIRQPLTHAGRPIGVLVLAPAPGRAFSAADRRLAAALAHPAAALTAVALRLAAAEDRAGRIEDAAALRAEIVAAVDHDLRTPLTTILGALQTLARPESAPTDPDLSALLSSALGQAKRLRHLLGDLLLASSTAPRREAVLPEALTALITEAARDGMGEKAKASIEVPVDLPPATVDPPALRRALAGVLRQVCRRGAAARVEVLARGDDAVITVTAEGQGPLVPGLSARLAVIMGGSFEESADTANGTTEACLVLPGALGPLPAPDTP